MASDLVTTDVRRAVDAIRGGGLVGMPTETVYGLAADASNPAAIERIFEVKGRPASHPLIVHLSGPGDLDEWADHPSDGALMLADAAWPGPLTLIVPRSGRVSETITGGRDTVGVRVPAHPMASELIAGAGPVAAPSANRFGAVSPTTAQHVADDLVGRLDPDRDVVLDGGPCPVGVESTIVDCTTEPPQVLRAGAVPVEDVERLLDDRVAAASGPSRASGMLASHYAPRCEVRLVDHTDDAEALRAGTPGAEVLDLGPDLVVAARSLYAELRDADRRGVGTLVVVLPPPEGLGHAIRDRLTKAAAPRR